MAEERTTTEAASSPVPRARGTAEPPLTNPTKVAKAAAKKTTAKKTTAKKTTAKKAAASKTTASKTTASKTTASTAAAPAKATRTTKATKATKPTKAAKAAKAAPATPPPASPATTPGAWTAAVRAALSDADQPPHRLAELAVAELGPRAAAWASWLRRTYPDPPAHGMVRLATHEARQAAWALAAVEAGGPVATILSLPAVAWVRAMLVLKIAAAYGHDPADPKRAADLIELLDLAAGERRLPGGLLSTARGHRRRLAGLLAARFGVRRAPVRAGLRMLIAGGDLGAQLSRLADRAGAHYRGRHGSQDRTSASAASISSPNSP